MRIKRSNNESGQAIVLIVLAIVALLGFVALSVDVGQAYSNRRTAQNASDASALGGAEKVSQSLKNVNNLNWSCSTQAANTNYWVDAANAAVQRAGDNDFVIAPATGVVTDLGGGRMSVKYGIDTKNGVEIICDPEPYVDVHVQLTSKVQASFLQFVNSGEMVNTVDTVVRVRPKIVYGNGAAILALKHTCDSTQKNGGLYFDGNIKVYVKDGDIISNSCLEKNASGGGSGEVHAEPQDITYRTTLKPSAPVTGMDPQNPTHVSSTVEVDWPSLESRLDSACKNVAYYNLASKPQIKASNSEVKTYNPGNYSGIDVKGKVTLTAGLYCIYGETNITGTFTAENVTLYVPATAHGGFTVGSSASAKIYADKTGCEYDVPGCSNIIGGLAILYLPSYSEHNYNQLSISANSTSTYRGSIIAPRAVVDVGGNPGADSVDSQIIGETIKIHGNGNLNVNYKKDYAVVVPTMMNLQK